MVRPLVDHALAIATAREIRYVRVHRIRIPCLPVVMTRAVFGLVHLLRLIHPCPAAFRTRYSGSAIIAPPEDERISVLQSGLEVAAEGFALAEVYRWRRPGVPGQILGGGEAGVDGGVVVVQPRHPPAVLTLR